MPQDDPLAQVLGMLAGVKRTGSGYDARCPAHDDDEASLSVGVGEDGRLLLHCHAGCKPDAVVAALGLRMRDLFPRDETPRAAVVRRVRYSVRDAEGRLVAIHVRTDKAGGKKEMWWELPDGTRRLNGLKLEDLPLYRVEMLHRDDRSVVFVVEGEKAADALGSLGVPVVGTVTGSSACPSQDQLGHLADREVILWPDNDDAGRQHMERVAARLDAIGVACRVVVWPDAPTKGDAADFVAKGLGLDELRALYADAPYWAPAAAGSLEAPGDALAHLTDLGNAQRLVARHGPNIRWCDGMGRWFHWNGELWEQVSGTILQDLAKETALSIYDEAVAAPDREQQVALMKWAKSSGSARSIASMVALTKTVVGEIAIDADKLDADPMVLGVQNGVVDLRTGEGRLPARDDFVTKCCRAAFDPDAACPLWDAFLDRIFDGNADLVGYVQRAVGYSLTGKTGERVILILHGTGANGKTTFQEVVAHVMGTYAMSTPVETLVAKKDRGIPNDLARLKSARFVSATESERGAKLAEAFIKAVTGGDRVTARFLHQEFFDFVPQLKLWLATNHRPEISGGGKAVWSRVRLVPFEVEIPEDERDPDLKAKLLEEANGILAWAIRGCLEWQRTGLREPQTITAANRGYEEDEDVLGAWIEDCCVVEPNVWTGSTELYTSFAAWAKGHGEEELSAKAFTQSLAERKNLRRQRQAGSGVRGFSGIRLLETVASAKRKRQEDGLDD